MIVNVVRIGNSRGIRIPKSILEQCNVGFEVSLEIENGKIILEPIDAAPRRGWAEAFQRMHRSDDDTLLIDDSVDLESDEWEW